MPSTCPAAIIGAGPYGLAAAAYLRGAGVEAHVFGKSMEFWQRQMPHGMFLRSAWSASHIADPDRALTLDAYQAKEGVQLSTPVPLADFIAYGLWFQRQVAPDLDPRMVNCIDAAPSGFRLQLDDGESLQAQRVIIAGGIAPFAHRPAQFDGLPAALASHSAGHCDLGLFANKRVAVVGGGQSAIESAVLLHEGGAEVEVIARAPNIHWLRRSARLHSLPLTIRGALYPPTDVGPPVLNQIVARPMLFRQLPRDLQSWVAKRSIQPAAAGWLFRRADGVRITTQCNVVSAVRRGDQLSLTLDDESMRTVDHVLLATGFRVNVARYPFLSSQLVKSLGLIEGYPLLNLGFESTVRGLHFLGAPAAWSFGPLLRFVSGAQFAASSLTRSIVGR